jgi:hypothetical protein
VGLHCTPSSLPFTHGCHCDSSRLLLRAAYASKEAEVRELKETVALMSK